MGARFSRSLVVPTASHDAIEFDTRLVDGGELN